MTFCHKSENFIFNSVLACVECDIPTHCKFVLFPYYMVIYRNSEHSILCDGISFFLWERAMWWYFSVKEKNQPKKIDKNI